MVWINSIEWGSFRFDSNKDTVTRECNRLRFFYAAKGKNMWRALQRVQPGFIVSPGIQVGGTIGENYGNIPVS